MSDQSAGGFKGEQSDVSVLQTATVTCADALTPERSDVHVFKGLLVKSSATHACDAPRQLLFLTTRPSPIEETDPQDIDVNSITEDTRISYLLHADPDVMDGEVGLLIPTPPSLSPRMLSAFSRVHGAPRDSSQVLTTGTTRRHASRTTRLSLQPMKMGWQHGGYVRSWNYHKENLLSSHESLCNSDLGQIQEEVPRVVPQELTTERLGSRPARLSSSMPASCKAPTS